MPSIEPAIETLSQLIAFPSVSNTSNKAVSEYCCEQLESLGFVVHQSSYIDDSNIEKVNVVAKRIPTGSGSNSGLAYFCHTDVVPAEDWTGPGGDPFSGVLTNDRIYGRGACDMKGSLVAMLAAAAQVSASDQQGPLWIVCTADEEVGFDGARKLVSSSPEYREIVASQPNVIIGEPTSLGVVHAHKGITGFEVISHGRAAHSSTTDGINANEKIVPILNKLLEIGERTVSDKRYQDDRFDPPFLSWNFGVSDRATAVNITPAKSTAWVCFRSMPNVDGENLISEVRELADSLGLEFRRRAGGGHVWVNPDSECVQRMCQIAGGRPKTVCYGTDGGEFSELKNMVVLGPGDIAQAHTADEWLSLEQLSKGIQVFTDAIGQCC